MITLGYFKVSSFTNLKDSQGFSVAVDAYRVEMPEAFFKIYLPPFMRKSTCEIEEGSTLFCIVDTVTGQGCALYSEDADFNYSFNADVVIGKSLSVEDNIESKNGDVKAGLISLKNHKHPITVATFSGTISPTGQASGDVTGGTDEPEKPVV